MVARSERDVPLALPDLRQQLADRLQPARFAGKGDRTLLTRLATAAESNAGITFVGSAEPMYVPYSQLHDESLAVAAALQARGIGPASHVAILGPTTRALVTAIRGTWMAGAAIVALPLPMRLGSLEEFVAQTRARIRNADAALVLVDEDLAAFVDLEPGDPPIISLGELQPGRAGLFGSGAYEAPIVRPEDLAILQYTSGSTSEPKGVMLPHGQVSANVDAIALGVALEPDTDVAVSWLPLYHDMGLIGLLLTPMATGTPLVLAAPQDFLAAPSRWLEWIARYRGTVTAGPNFSYVLAARALKRAGSLDLSSWRLGLNGAEPIDCDSVEAFCAAGAAHGLDARSVFPAFGMAEATLAVTFPQPFTGLRWDTVSTRVLETDRYAARVDDAAEGSRRLAKLGTPVAGIDVRIVDRAAQPGSPRTVMAEREVGELQIRGESVTTGYYRRADATAAAFDGEWLNTGDLAYRTDGELVVAGRIKDVIIVGGRNVFPEDIERAVSSVEGVRAGNVIAFGVPGRAGKESIVVVAEARVGSDPRSEVARRVRDAIGIPPEDVVIVLPGSLPKTSSGKLQRSLCRDRYVDDSLPIA